MPTSLSPGYYTITENNEVAERVSAEFKVPDFLSRIEDGSLPDECRVIGLEEVHGNKRLRRRFKQVLERHGGRLQFENYVVVFVLEEVHTIGREMGVVDGYVDLNALFPNKAETAGETGTLLFPMM